MCPSIQDLRSSSSPLLDRALWVAMLSVSHACVTLISFLSMRMRGVGIIIAVTFFLNLHSCSTTPMVCSSSSDPFAGDVRTFLPKYPLVNSFTGVVCHLLYPSSNAHFNFIISISLASSSWLSLFMVVGLLLVSDPFSLLTAQLVSCLIGAIYAILSLVWIGIHTNVRSFIAWVVKRKKKKLYGKNLKSFVKGGRRYSMLSIIKKVRQKVILR